MKNKNTIIEEIMGSENSKEILFGFWKEYAESKDADERDKTIEKYTTKIDSLLSSSLLKLLEDYNNFLLKKGYTDADIYAEHPTAIEQFLEL